MKKIILLFILGMCILSLIAYATDIEINGATYCQGNAFVRMDNVEGGYEDIAQSFSVPVNSTLAGFNIYIEAVQNCDQNWLEDFIVSVRENIDGVNLASNTHDDCDFLNVSSYNYFDFLSEELDLTANETYYVVVSSTNSTIPNIGQELDVYSGMFTAEEGCVGEWLSVYDNGIAYGNGSSTGFVWLDMGSDIRMNITYSEIEECSSDWVCNGYDLCDSYKNKQLCNSVIDLNSCDEEYIGDYSEFEPNNCYSLKYPTLFNLSVIMIVIGFIMVYIITQLWK